MPKSRTILRNLTMSRLTSRRPAQADLDEPVELIRKLDVAVLDRLQRDLLPRLVPVDRLRGSALAGQHLPEFRDEILQTRIVLRRAQIFRAQCAFFHVALPLHEVTPADRLADARALESRNIGEHEKKDTKRPRKFHAGAGSARGLIADTCSLSACFRVPFASRCAATRPASHRRGERCPKLEEMPMSPITTASGLTIEATVIGEGAAAAAGRDVVVHYAGWLAHGTQFDSSKEKQDPFEFPLGRKEVMPGWEEGLAGMKVGGTRKLTIPPQLAYGEEGAGDTIPPNETLTFEVELLAVS